MSGRFEEFYKGLVYRKYRIIWNEGDIIKGMEKGGKWEKME